jgi:hypothetical protein
MLTTLSLLTLLLYVLTSTTCYAAVTQLYDHRSLFLVNVSASNVTTDVSPMYMAMGYTSDHSSLCTVTIYGTAENMAAGDHDLNLISKALKSRFNAIEKSVDANVSLLATRFEIITQNLGTTERRRRDLRKTSSWHRSLLNMVYFNSAYGMLTYTCRGCSLDSSDARRMLQENLFESKFIDELATDMVNSPSTYLSQALEETSCLKISCDDGDTYETNGCQDIV